MSVCSWRENGLLERGCTVPMTWEADTLLYFVVLPHGRNEASVQYPAQVQYSTYRIRHIYTFIRGRTTSHYTSSFPNEWSRDTVCFWTVSLAYFSLKVPGYSSLRMLPSAQGSLVRRFFAKEGIRFPALCLLVNESVQTAITVYTSRHDMTWHGSQW